MGIIATAARQVLLELCKNINIINNSLGTLFRMNSALFLHIVEANLKSEIKHVDIIINNGQ